MRRLFLAMVLVLGSLAVSPAPAQAIHANSFAHWGHGYKPFVKSAAVAGADGCNASGTNFCTFFGNAESHWKSNGFSRGFTPAGATNSCGWQGGGIVYCPVFSGTTISVGFGSCVIGETCSAAIFERYVYNPNKHLDAVSLYYCRDCGYNSDRLKRIFRHELGHSIGLGHSVDSNSVMHVDATKRCPELNGPFCLPNATGANQHDRDALFNDMYNGHNEG